MCKDTGDEKLFISALKGVVLQSRVEPLNHVFKYADDCYFVVPASSVHIKPIQIELEQMSTSVLGFIVEISVLKSQS